MSSAIQIVETARQNMLRAIKAGAKAGLPDPGARWGGYSLQTRAAVQKFKTPLEVIHYAQLLQGSFESRHTGIALLDYAEMFQGMLLKEFPEFWKQLPSFAETPLSLPSTLVELDGRPVSSPVLSHTYNILRCLRHVRPAAVLDIGGGTGSAGRLWATNPIHRPGVYIDLDLPESLFFSEVYLKTALPDGHVTYVHDRSDLDSPATIGNGASDVSRVFLVPVHNHRLIRDVALDLVVNTGSLQEMTPAYVDFYMELIEASKARNFYSSNYFAQRIEMLVESMNFASPIMGAGWGSKFRKWHPDPTQGVAEVLFERLASADCQTIQVEDEAARLLRDTRIDSGAAFLEVFDVVRRVRNPDLLVAAAAKAREEMGYTPKEVLWLVRRAHELSPNSEPIRANLVLLEKLARPAQAQAGMVAGNAAGARAEYLRRTYCAPTSAGRLIEEDETDVVEIDNKRRPLRPYDCGAVERRERLGDTLIIGGWALDRSVDETPICVHVFQNGTIVATAEPSIERPEFAARNPSVGFECAVSAEPPPCLIAEFADGSVGVLANQESRIRHGARISDGSARLPEGLS